MRGEPFVDERGRFVEHHGLPADDDLAAELRAHDDEDDYPYDEP
jgi:hypothetical protein